MATYKVLQDIESDEKLVGPLTLRQFIYACISALFTYLGFLAATKGAPFMLLIFLPVAAICGFFAWPWGQDQPTEVWALARIRFLIKPRRRIWDQNGAKELVTVTAPKTVEQQRTDGLDQDEVRSRLAALADTIDSRGWAVKDANLNLSNVIGSALVNTSDRLVQASSFPQEVSDVDVKAADDILDESANPVAHQFNSMINAAGVTYRQQLLTQMQQADPILPKPVAMPSTTTPPQPPPAQVSNDDWFMQGQTPTVNDGLQTAPAPVAAQPQPPGPFAQTIQAAAPAANEPGADEEALIEKLKAGNASATMTAAYGHMKTIKTPEQLRAEAQQAQVTEPAKPKVTLRERAAIINLANNNDLSVETIAKQAHEQVSDNNGEVVISLH